MKPEPTLTTMLTVALLQHREMTPGEAHGPEHCSTCLLLALLGVLLASMGAGDLPAVPLLPTGGRA